MDSISLFHLKNEYMSNAYPEISALELYSEIFPPETLESKSTDRRAPNPIFSIKLKEGKRTFFRNIIVFGDVFKESVEQTQGNPLALCSMISYSGRHKTAQAAYQCHGFIIDLDGVGMEELQSFWGWVESLEAIPNPTYIANSGHGLHVYYLFQNPVPLYPGVVDHLQRLKHGLTEWVWNRETSNYTPQERQFQGIYQGFRMVGSQTKLEGPNGERYMVKAWRTGPPVTIDYLNRFVDDEYKAPTSPDYSSWDWRYGEDHYSLEDCRQMFPEWYQRRIVEGRAPARWTCNGGLYTWWLDTIQKGAKDGTRYWCIAYLYVYAIKCGIDKETADADAMNLLDPFNDRTVRPDNAFTVDDIRAAAEFYDEKYVRVSKKTISYRTKIAMPQTRRNGRKQDEHIKRMTILRDGLYPDGAWRQGNGRKPKKDIVAEWRKEHPQGRKADCIRETGLSKPTVIKWWNEQA